MHKVHVSSLQKGGKTKAEQKILVGDPVPDLEAKNQDGKTIRLSDFRGKPVLLYFYPKDDTPGCTREACELRDEYSKFQRLNAVILGISAQTEESHREFKNKYHLPFDLLVDKKGELAQALGLDMTPLIGLHKRQSALLSPSGRLVRVYKKVDPEKHASEVLDDLKIVAER